MWLKSFIVFALAITGAPAAKSDDPKEASLDGTWLPISAELSGQKFPDEVRKSIRLELKGDQYCVTVGETSDRGTCKQDLSSKPRTLDIKGTEGPNKGKTLLAIYERNGDTLKVCYDMSGKGRPTEFSSKPGSFHFLVEYQLKKP